MQTTTRTLLAEATPTPDMVDRFLARAAFDAELGYVAHSDVAQDGLDGCYTVTTVLSSGERRMMNYADGPCRINTYGDSFTQCARVSDGETWQEALAAHIGEPIRNYGVGGHGVYQAYRRMLREENSQRPAEYVILNVFDDDHVRSIYTWRWIHMRRLRLGVGTFGRNPWAHLRLDLQGGGFQEQPNPYPTPESLYRLADKDHVYEAFKDQLDVQAFMATQHATDVNLGLLRRMGEALDVPTDFSDPEATARTGQRLLQTYGIRSSMYVLDKAGDFAQQQGKKLLVLLSYSRANLQKACEGQSRFDQSFLDFLRDNGFLFVDGLAAHLEDYAAFRCSPEDYAKRFYVPDGHYSPRGNHFFAFAVREPLIAWLEPKPPCYRKGGPTL